jgi:hypothetical protein
VKTIKDSIKSCKYKVSHLSDDEAVAKMGHPVLGLINKNEQAGYSACSTKKTSDIAEIVIYDGS